MNVTAGRRALTADAAQTVPAARASFRVGTDVLAVSNVRQSLLDHGQRYLQRVYTEAEVADSMSRTGPDPQRLAARFAAKEAALKVLRTPGTAFPWRSLELVRTTWGGVSLELSGAAAAHAAREGLTNFDVSLSHDGGFAMAVVVATESPLGGRP